MSRSERRPAVRPSRRSESSGTGCEVGLACQRCLSFLHLPRQIGACRAHDLAAHLARVDHHDIGRSDHTRVKLETRQTADVHPRFQPLLREHWLQTVGRAHNDVTLRNRFACGRNRDDLDTQFCLHLPRECFAPFATWAVAPNSLDAADGADRHRLSARLPACAEKGDIASVIPRQKLRRQPARRAGAHALHNAVGINRQAARRCAYRKAIPGRHSVRSAPRAL